MSEFSRETLLNIIETDHVQCGEASALARMALAAMDSEPVAEVYQPQNAGICAPLGPSIRMLCPLEPGTKLYRHAQQPVVPDAATAIRACLSEFPESVRDIVEECADIAENSCRAAMLHGVPAEL
ncbi:hypothetical protein AB0072_16195 [Klebsiella pneumoniae]|uniref:hypothetical protein n=1 Tax=Klebsiella pneumoniae TaxID=573 RepID=UPI0007D6E535|nr:hypothetical protein [Klebsiella pneumoniae]EMF2455999.1 hypothetical protein [Klebsiella pneumoniae]MBC4902046.1 hypothetical protein [Klebsiella pneumoniae]MBM6481952.1 hypothetical protein [Klebsiella pneumoniae]MDR4828001.1 hypothetical protein [Klebsiella pneumoniae]QRC68140.1 hypothetical protein JN237_14650 [Klebsiella pneumoniae]